MQPSPAAYDALALLVKFKNRLISGLMCHCPNCGAYPLLAGFLAAALRCSICGQDLSHVDSGDGPVVFILLTVGAIGCRGLPCTELTFHPPIWLELVIWLPGIAVLTIGALRPVKSMLIALQFHNHAFAVRSDKRR